MTHTRISNLTFIGSDQGWGQVLFEVLESSTSTFHICKYKYKFKYSKYLGDIKYKYVFIQVQAKHLPCHSELHHTREPQFPQLSYPSMVQLLVGIISLRRVREANPGRSHGSTDTLPLRRSAIAIHHRISLSSPSAMTIDSRFSG